MSCNDVIDDAATRTLEAHKVTDEACKAAQALATQAEKEAAAVEAQRAESERYEATIAAVAAKVAALPPAEVTALTAKMIVRLCDFSMRHEQYNGHVQNLSNLCGGLMNQVKELMKALDAQKSEHQRLLEHVHNVETANHQKLGQVLQAAAKASPDAMQQFRDEINMEFGHLAAVVRKCELAMMNLEKPPMTAPLEASLTKTERSLKRESDRITTLETVVNCINFRVNALERVPSDVARLTFQVDRLRSHYDALSTRRYDELSNASQPDDMGEHLVSTIVDGDE